MKPITRLPVLKDRFNNENAKPSGSRVYQGSSEVCADAAAKPLLPIC